MCRHLICISKPEIPDEQGAILETEFNYEDMLRKQKAHTEAQGQGEDVWRFSFQSRGCGDADNSITKDCIALQNKPGLVAYVEKQIEEEGNRPTGCLFLLCGVFPKHVHLLKDIDLVARTLSHTYWYVSVQHDLSLELERVSFGVQGGMQCPRCLGDFRRPGTICTTKPNG